MVWIPMTKHRIIATIYLLELRNVSKSVYQGWDFTCFIYYFNIHFCSLEEGLKGMLMQV